jgi:hypothetical protein
MTKTLSLDFYRITFLFKSPSACNMFIIVFNFFIGLAGALTCLILRFIHITQGMHFLLYKY